VWCEEAQSLSVESLRLLLPTIREEGAEFYFTYNPETEEDAVEIIKTRKDVLDVEVNWNDNPFFPEQLKMEMEADFISNPDEADHIWNGQYRKQADNSVMSRLAVHEAMEREISDEGDWEIAVDVARYGSDSSIISMRKGLVLKALKEYKNISLVELCGHIEVMAGNNHDMRIKVDETGVGGGVVDILQSRGYREVVGINFGSKASEEDKFADLPSEMWCTFPISEVSLLNDSSLFHELTDRRFSYDRKARRQIESKDSYKARNGGKSPDRADSVLMLFYEPKIIRPMLY
jgi:phage terminase large subunit